MKQFNLLVLSLLFLGLYNCGCPSYVRTKGKAKKPIILLTDGSMRRLTKEKDIGILFESLPRNNWKPYQLPNDSMVVGNTVFISTGPEVPALLVGKGSEFELGKCKFRVLYVDPDYRYDSIKQDAYGEFIMLQTIAYPKFCPVQNAQLRKFERMHPPSAIDSIVNIHK